jgi:phosphoserine phosphatase
MSSSLKKHVSAALDGDLAIPLVVDFDGTMHLSDLTWEGIWWVMKTRPWVLAKLGWLHARHGRAAMKLALESLAETYDWAPVLPWEERVLERIAQEKARGRVVIIVTGSTTKLVKKAVVAKGLDYEVVGTERADINLTGPRKAAALVAKWGAKKFDYIGNSRDDWAVWKEGRYALVVGNDRKIRAGAAKVSEVIWEVDTERRRMVRLPWKRKRAG